MSKKQFSYQFKLCRTTSFCVNEVMIFTKTMVTLGINQFWTLAKLIFPPSSMTLLQTESMWIASKTLRKCFFDFILPIQNVQSYWSCSLTSISYLAQYLTNIAREEHTIWYAKDPYLFGWSISSITFEFSILDGPISVPSLLLWYPHKW